MWQNIKKKFNKDDIILPLILYYDDVELGNALGSHAGKNKLGCGYATIANSPFSFASKLKNIIITDLFYTEDRKKYGNRAVFQPLINELQMLRDNGMIINIDNTDIRIFLIPSIITGDMLGLTGMLGFVELFNNTKCCRVCYVSSDESKMLVEEKESLIRTKESYEKDLKIINTPASGIKERCIFNDLSDFHVTENIYSDIMHDVDEGFANSVMAEIILKFISDEIFTIDYLNNRLESVNLDFESRNKPPPIDIVYLKKKQ